MICVSSATIKSRWTLRERTPRGRPRSRRTRCWSCPEGDLEKPRLETLYCWPFRTWTEGDVNFPIWQQLWWKSMTVDFTSWSVRLASLTRFTPGTNSPLHKSHSWHWMMLTWTGSSLSGQLPVRRVWEGVKGSSDALVLGNVSTRDASVSKLIESVIQDATTEGQSWLILLWIYLVTCIDFNFDHY